MSQEDVITEFVQESHQEKGSRETMEMKKCQGSAGFCIRASGSPKAINKLAEIMNKIDLSEHQQQEA